MAFCFQGLLGVGCWVLGFGCLKITFLFYILGFYILYFASFVVGWSLRSVVGFYLTLLVVSKHTLINL